MEKLEYLEWYKVMQSEDGEFWRIPLETKRAMYDRYIGRQADADNLKGVKRHGEG